MTIQRPRSMLYPGHVVFEQLPPYTPREQPSSPSEQTNWETSSIHSTAPSYTSVAPSYHSLIFSSATGTTPGTSSSWSPRVLHSHSSYSGYRRRDSVLSDAPPSNLNSMYNIAEWSPVAEGLQSRLYHNVAKRRAAASIMEEGTSSRRSLSRTTLYPPPSRARMSSSISAPSLAPTVSPHARLILPESDDSVLHEEESKTWDFMSTQMAEWSNRNNTNTNTSKRVLSPDSAAAAGSNQRRLSFAGTTSSMLTGAPQRMMRRSLTTVSAVDPTTSPSCRQRRRSSLFEPSGDSDGSGSIRSTSLKRRLKRRVTKFIAGIYDR